MTRPPPDLFPERPVRSDMAARHSRVRAPSYRARRVITVTIVGLIVIGIVRFVVGSTTLMTPGAVATIKAEGAWKQRPERPGGLDIPNQNVQVYQSLDDKSGTKPLAEHLLPLPEVPQLPQPLASGDTAPPLLLPPVAPPSEKVETLTPPQLSIDTIPTTIIPAATPPSTSASSALADATAMPQPVPAPLTPVVGAPMVAPLSPGTPSPASASTSSASSEEQPAASGAPQLAPTTKPLVKTKSPPAFPQVLKDQAPAPKNTRVVQLASAKDETTAQAMAGQLQTRYAGILGSAHLRLVKAEIEGRGVYYRIQSQPIASDHADNICQALKNMKAGCILVRP